jgi:DNA-binding NarL/FixJ family response regulator
MTERQQIRILIVDDHPLFREGIATVIKNQQDMLLVAEAASGAQALQKFLEHRPDVTLMDVRLRDSSGMDTMIAVRTRFSEARIILLTTYEDDIDLESALQAGIWGHILKTMPPREMVEIIRQVYAGRRCVPPPAAPRPAEHLGSKSLTSREVEYLVRAAGGNRIHEFGHRVLHPENTVKKQMKRIMQKLGAQDQTSALCIAARRGFIRL